VNERFIVPPDAAERQRAAADPLSSAWVSANAGAGKTKVLTDRVIRLMLAGSPPSRILCLTFTKAAAAEMTIRVFETLGDWVTMEDRPLADALLALTGEKPKPALLARARRLFARAVETPGGLKIETIHAFCERLLHLVPFEADVPPRFAVLDDTEAAEIMTEARGIVLTEAAGAGQDSELGRALDRVTQEATGDPLIQLLAEAVANPTLPTEPAAREEALRSLAAVLDLAPGETPEAVRRAIVEDGIPGTEWLSIAAELEATGQPRNCERAAELRLAARATDVFDRAEHYRAIFFTKEGRPLAQLVTRKVPAALRGRLEVEQGRLVQLIERLRAAEALERTSALYRLAAAVRERYEALKRRLGALDFADLIERTLRLLEGGAAAWVLYRLDHGIDHVLVDEAQDTNAEQWRILMKLTEDFTAGAGRPSRVVRTIFAVGDPKQSIYSFQGADPRLFEEGRTHWLGRHRSADMRFADIRLALSFRSAPTILRCVDATFGVDAHFRGLSAESGVGGTVHESARPRAPGLIEIWLTQVPDPRAPEPDAWSLPVDTPDQRSPALATARRVAEAVRHWTTVPDPETGHVWRPGQILILARRRGPAFFAVIRALKANGVPVAGADRIDVNQQIAVNDLVAAGQAALLRGHDLALAAALKSPLIGLDDDDLVRIAADRPDGRSLEDALEAAAPGDPRAANALEVLRTWRDSARRHGPFGFYATLLGPGGGRRRLVERLGGEAQDAIDTFLCRAQAEETSLEAPSLTAFLARFEASEHVIKRDPESRTDEVRVMTVHGAKGLEAPLVVLLDGCEVGGRDPRLIGVPVALGDSELPVWAPRKDDDPRPVADARAALRGRMLEEHNRLLYVALTRARDRLVLAPYTGMLGREREEAWCGMVRRGLGAAGAELVTTEAPYGPIEVLREGSAETALAPPPAMPPLLAVPDWLGRPVPPEPESAPPLRPSSALGAADRAPGGTAFAERARRRGILVHALLDHLAGQDPGARGEAAARFLAARAPGTDAAERQGLAAQTLAVLQHRELAALFGPGSRGEAAVAGTVGPPGLEREVSGQIDRLFVGEDRIVVADIKTGRPPKDNVPPRPYVAQLAVYAALLREAHPGLPLRALLVWPEGPVVVDLPEEALAAALDQVVGTRASAPTLP
jgi:ATP-dependent helicase/nuclease subunit A